MSEGSAAAVAPTDTSTSGARTPFLPVSGSCHAPVVLSGPARGADLHELVPPLAAIPRHEGFLARKERDSAFAKGLKNNGYKC